MIRQWVKHCGLVLGLLAALMPAAAWGQQQTPPAATVNLGLQPVTTATPSNLVSATGNAAPTLSSFSLQGSTNAAYPNIRNFQVNLGLTSNSAASCTAGPQCGNVTLYTGIVGMAGTSNIWAQNTLITLTAGSGHYAAQGSEMDFNNFDEDRGDAAGIAGILDANGVAAGHTISGAGSYLSSAALLILGSQNTFGANPGGPIWNRGAGCANASVVQACLFDYTTDRVMGEQYGSHTATFDATTATLSLAFAIVPTGVSGLLFTGPGGTTGAEIRGLTSGAMSIGLTSLPNSVYGTSMALGFSNTAAGVQTFTQGSSNVAGGSYSSVRGRQGYDENRDAVDCWAGQAIATSGDTQACKALVHAATAGTGTVRLTTNGTQGVASTVNCFPLPNNSAFILSAKVLFRDTTTGDAANWTSDDVLVTRGATASTLTLVGMPLFTAKNATSGATGDSVAWVADTTNGCAGIAITSGTSHVSHWIGEIKSVEGL